MILNIIFFFFKIIKKIFISKLLFQGLNIYTHIYMFTCVFMVVVLIMGQRISPSRTKARKAFDIHSIMDHNNIQGILQETNGGENHRDKNECIVDRHSYIYVYKKKKTHNLFTAYIKQDN